MTKINVIYYNSTLLKGGTDTYMLDVIRNINKNDFQIDVIIKDGEIVDKYMLEELKSLGSNVHLAKGSFVKRMLFLRKFFKENKNKYQVAHINATSAATGIIAYFAKHNGNVNKVIFHSHMGGNDNGKSFIDKIGTTLMLKNTNVFATCSKVASEFMYENKVDEKNIIKLNNSVNTKKFEFNKDVRKKLRDELNISKDTFVILHTGRFAPQKNHNKLIEIFNEFLKKNPNSKLALIGDGVLFDDVKTQVKELGIENNVLFLGLKNNVNEFMSMADCFVMPSIHEGLPIVAVEAQASDLPLVLSSNISTETKLTENVTFVDLEDSLEVWCNAILKSKNNSRKSNEKLFTKLGFDKASTTKVIENLYKN